MSHAKVFYRVGTPKKLIASISGEVIEVADRWVTIIPDDEGVSKVLIPAMNVVTVEYTPHPLEEAIETATKNSEPIDYAWVCYLWPSDKGSTWHALPNGLDGKPACGGTVGAAMSFQWTCPPDGSCSKCLSIVNKEQTP